MEPSVNLMQQEGWALTGLPYQPEAKIHMLPENGPQGILSLTLVRIMGLWVLGAFTRV